MRPQNGRTFLNQLLKEASNLWSRHRSPRSESLVSPRSRQSARSVSQDSNSDVLHLQVLVDADFVTILCTIPQTARSEQAHRSRGTLSSLYAMLQLRKAAQRNLCPKRSLQQVQNSRSQSFCFKNQSIVIDVKGTPH